MDPQAARRARQTKIKQDLLEAFTDEEACPPEWVEVLMEVNEAVDTLHDLIGRETERFATDPDIRRALERRERVRAEVDERVAKINTRIRRLNLLAPLPRFQRAALDADEELRPLYRTRRQPVS